MGIGKKIKSVAKHGIDPIKIGKRNFENPTEEVEQLARDRVKYCECLEDEPISFLRVEDKRIPELSNKMCGRCGCTAPYLFRQSVKMCKGWQR